MTIVRTLKSTSNIYQQKETSGNPKKISIKLFKNHFLWRKIPFAAFSAEHMMVKDSEGIRLYAALTAISSGANDKSLDKNFAVSNPPRFLLYQGINLSIILPGTVISVNEKKLRNSFKPYVELDQLQFRHHSCL